MKKCPFCAEEVQDEAVKCKHCQSVLSKPSIEGAETLKTDNTTKNKLSEDLSATLIEAFNPSTFKMPLIRWLLWFFYFVIFIPLLWSIPFFAIIFLLLPVWGIKTNKDREKATIRLKEWNSHKIRIGFSIFFILLAIFAFRSSEQLDKKAQMISEYPVPTIEVISDTGDQGDNLEYTLQFRASNTDYAKVNITELYANEEGIFETVVPLDYLPTIITITAFNKQKETTQNITITRNKTAEELAKEAVDQAEQRTWDQSRAGQLCKKYPTWTKSDCEYVADGRYWIGMSYDMLIESFGKPNHANPSNYGGKTSWQWCWTYSNPSCFYDNNDDGIIDAYN